MYSCPISTVLANSACSEALWVSVSRFAVRVSSESLKLVICSAPFCVINVNCSGVEVYLLFLLPNFPGASTKDSGSHNCRYIVGCLPAWSGWQSQCFHMCLGSGKFFLLSSSVQAVMVPSLEILNVKCDTRMCQPSAMRSCPIVLGFSLRCPFYHVFSDANSKKHQCSGLNCVPNAATSLALCKQISILPLFVESMSLNIDMKYDPIFNGFWISPVQICLNMLLVVESGNTWWYVPNELHFSGCQTRFSANPCSFHRPSSFVAQVLDGFGFEIPTHSVESGNTWTFILINYAAVSPSNVMLEQRNVCQSCDICMLYAAVPSISVCTCRCTDCIKSGVLVKRFVHRHSLPILVILTQPKSSP